MEEVLDLALIPTPVSVQRRPGRFDLRGNGLRIAADEPLHAEAERFAKLLSIWRGAAVPMAEVGTGPVIRFAVREPDGNDESYELAIAPTSIRITTATRVGAYRAIQTLTQLLPPGAFATPAKAVSGSLLMPCLKIIDRPRFKWRGLMLDVCRHLFSKEEILRHLDAMAMHKLNIFHWHLTEDQGWRIAIERHPSLTKKGAYRDGGDGVLTPSRQPLQTPAPGRYGGYYTQDDVREIVAYAAERHITVVPEIEMPGHALAALTAFPELACTDGPFKPATQMGVFKDVFCAGNDAVFELLERVLEEVVALFPGPFIHVGGDECPKDRWKTCPKCQARIQQERLGDEHGLQSYFMRRIERFLTSHGKRLIGWDEILEGGLAPNATVMSWRGTDGGIAAAQAGHDVVMTPHMHLYLDYRQAEEGEPTAIPSPAALTLADVYQYEPVPTELTDVQAKHILGVQANLWTEYVHNFRQVEYMTWPRGIALAEVGWSSLESRNFGDFEHRLAGHLRRLTARNVHFRPPETATPASRDVQPVGV
ncbi:MAG: hexosaminidase [Phycisphaerales bacterium]|nr:hexosaminidase [Phycisphaerales bacterium]